MLATILKHICLSYANQVKLILVQALKELGLIDEIGKAVGEIIGNAGDKKLLVAVLLILWVSAFASSFIDNIPYTTAMVIYYM